MMHKRTNGNAFALRNLSWTAKGPYFRTAPRSWSLFTQNLTLVGLMFGEDLLHHLGLNSAESLYFFSPGLRVFLLHLVDLSFIECGFTGFLLSINSVPIELELEWLCSVFVKCLLPFLLEWATWNRLSSRPRGVSCVDSHPFHRHKNI